MEFKLETTLLICDDCGHSLRVIGKNGTSIPYVGYCPRCGSQRVHVKFEILDLLDDDADIYGGS